VPGRTRLRRRSDVDIEVAGSIAPGATIVVLLYTNTTAAFIDAVNQAVQDTVHKPSVVSISWEGRRTRADRWISSSRRDWNQAIQDAAQLGVTICCAAGDDGSPDMALKGWDKKPHADFPSSSPFSLACGGHETFSDRRAIAGEVAGTKVRRTARAAAASAICSRCLPTRPTQGAESAQWQRRARLAGRGGNADPDTGYQIFLAGSQQVIGGTSAVAPLMAGLIALINQAWRRRRRARQPVS